MGGNVKLYGADGVKTNTAITEAVVTIDGELRTRSAELTDYELMGHESIDLLHSILQEQKKMNMYLALMNNCHIQDTEIE